MPYSTPLRRTKIICTIGPSSFDKGVLFGLAESGMNIVRLNVSHGTREDHQRIVDLVSEFNSTSDHQVAMMIDTRGAEIRTGDVQAPIPIAQGDEVLFVSDASEEPRDTRTVIRVSYDGFAQDVKETNTILIDNGELSFDVTSIQADGMVIGTAKEDGEIGSRRHINLPGADIDLPSITESDWEDIRFSAKQNLDFVALSFIRNAEEVVEARKVIEDIGATTQIISKIETQKGVEHIKEIVDVSDAIMVARGDLGADIPFEMLPGVQDEIVIRCRDAGKPVIIATHMLESMKEHPMPTRAEVTDIAHAVDTGADATMLSGETASGIHPLKALDAMVRVHTATEEHLGRLETAYEIRFHDSAEEEMEPAVQKAREEDVDAFVLLTDSGRTAKHIAKFRHTVPIIALTNSDTVARSLLLHYGVYPLVIEFDADDDVSIQAGVKKAMDLGLVQKKQKLMLLKDRAKSIEVTTI